MAGTVKRTGREYGDEAFERKLARLRASAEERTRIVASRPPFDYEAWVQEAGPATREELAEMEELLRTREVERQESFAHDEARSQRSGE